MTTTNEFLDWCQKGDADSEAAVREALEEHPELVRCTDTRGGGWDRTPLHHASYNGRENIARLLIQRGAAVNVQGRQGDSPLHLASYRVHEKVTRLLLEHGADVMALECDRGTPLHKASGNGLHGRRAKVVRILLQHGAEVNAQKRCGMTPLHSAAYCGHDDVVLLLLQHGAVVDIQDNLGLTPLHAACKSGRTAVVRVLLEHHADRSIRNNKRETARDIAVHKDHLEVVTLLDSYFPIPAQMTQVLLGLRGPTPSPLTRLASHSAFEPGVLSLIKCLLTGEPNPAFEKLQDEAQG